MSYFIEITPYVISGFKTTFLVFIFTLLLSIPLGLGLSVVEYYGNKWVKRGFFIYTWLMRGTPLILQLYVVVFGLPLLIPGFFTRDAFVGATLAFVLNYTAYFIEIFKGGLLAIPKGQWEAAQALHLSTWQTLRHIILPQVIKHTLYSLANESITLVKDTSLITVVGIGEVFRNAKEIMLRDIRIESLLIVALVYLIFTFIVITIFKLIAKKYRLEEVRL